MKRHSARSRGAAARGEYIAPESFPSPAPEVSGVTQAPHHIFIHPGDALAAVDAALRRLEAAGTGREAAGFVKYLHVTQAKQTVVFLTGRDVPLAAELRAIKGWMEPGDRPLP
ncbi:MAG TPA: hypothetical protein VF625_11135 [Longimicrobium sp.]